MIGRTNLTYDQLQTLVVESEGSVDAHPITYVYNDAESISFLLTLLHLIYGRQITTMPTSEHYKIISTYKSLTKKVQHHENLLEQFTKQWWNKYLLSLQEQSIPKSRNNQESGIAVRDITIVQNNMTNLNFWKLVKVEQLSLADGVTCAAHVRVYSENSNHSQLLHWSIQQKM